MEYKLWGTGSDGDSEEDEEALIEKQEESPQSSSGAYSSNGSSSAGISRNGINGHSDADGTVWGTEAPAFDNYEGGDALSRGNARFWTFRREDVRTQQAGSEDRSYSSSSGWTVLEPSRSEPVAVGLKAVDTNGIAEQESSKMQLQEDSSSKHSARFAWEDRRFVGDKIAILNGAPAAPAGPLSDVELRQSPASSSGRQSESAGEAQSAAVCFTPSICAVLSLSASHLSSGVLVQATKERGQQD